MIKRRVILGCSLLCGWLVLPWLLRWAAYGLDSLGWFSLHQLYYLPLGSWVGEPFFRPDSEVMFFVLPPGRVLTALFYLAIVGVIMLIRRAWRRRRT